MNSTLTDRRTDIINSLRAYRNELNRVRTNMALDDSGGAFSSLSNEASVLKQKIERLSEELYHLDFEIIRMEGEGAV